MKKYITSLISLFWVICSFGQEGVEVSLNTSTTNIISGTYIKDLNNVMDDYIGTWESIWNSKKITLEIQKVIKQTFTSESGYYYYRDILIGKYHIINLSNGEVIADTFDITEPLHEKIINTGTGKNSQMYFIYIDPDLCDISGEVLLKRDLSNPDILTYSYSYEEFYMTDDCEYHNDPNGIPIPIPTVNVTFTKQ